MLEKGISTQPTFIESGGIFITKPREVANHLSDFFSNKVQSLRKTVAKRSNSSTTSHLKEFMEHKFCQFEFTELTEETIRKLIKAVCKNKPSGVDNIEEKLIGMAVEYILGPICQILNTSLKTATFPQAWKEAKIIPLPKDKKKPFSAFNSRPISLLPALSKSFEKAMFDQIQLYFSKNNLLTSFQHAYRKGYSTCTALTQMVDEWYREMDSQRLCGAVLLDFSAAFDVIDHSLLIEKLELYGFKQASLTLMRSYLSNRSQCVYFNGSFSRKSISELWNSSRKLPWSTALFYLHK